MEAIQIKAVMMERDVLSNILQAEMKGGNQCKD
jgi:hypothetical protein